MSTITQNKCPYIGTIKRPLLDFDFEKVCSISLSTLNVYACLVCGKYFQGKGKDTYAYSHSLEEDHHLYINLDSQAIICLPDNYEVIDTTLDDIKSNLKPQYTKEQIKLLDKNTEFSYSLAGKEYLPGYIGLNNIKCNDYVNVVIQAFVHLQKIRDFFLMYETEFKKNDLQMIFIVRLGELFRKIWNNNNFKEHISPHEVLQAISLASDKKFVINKQSDSILFLSWMMNVLDIFFEKHKKNIGRNLIHDYFKGILQIETFTLIKDENEKNQKAKIKNAKFVKNDGLEYFYEKTKTFFYYLSMDLPNTPLFKDSNEKINIPQVPIYELLQKFNGEKFTDDPIKSQKKRYKILSFPKYLILVFKRFENNMFFTEKNPTIVNFTTENLTFSENNIRYDLMSNIIHDGKPNQGTFRIQIRHKGRNEWYEIQDLNVEKIVSQSVIVSESYIHFYEKVKENKKNERD